MKRPYSDLSNDINQSVDAAIESAAFASFDEDREEITFDDDMFADDIIVEDSLHILDQAPVKHVSDHPALVDNWDDAEGYYRIVLGELLNDRYHIHQSLGKGVFSCVVMGRDTVKDIDVAIKIIRNNSVMYKAGMKEYEILQKLKELDPDNKHHVIQCHRFFVHKQHLCLVFDSMREVLKKFGKDVGLNIKAVKVYAKQLLYALSLMKRANILHADIKPDNVLVNERMNSCCLSDLGSASSISDNITPYLVSRFYRAPEISAPYDYAIDIWSLGVSLFELYTGKILFNGKNNNHMLRSIQELKGKIPMKLIRKGQFASQHFDELYNFTSIDTESGKAVVRIIASFKQSRDIKSRLLANLATDSTEERNAVVLFADLIEKMLVLNPEKRITVKEAMMHPFIQYIQ